MKARQIYTVFRYGGLLAIFLIAVETAKRSYISKTTELDIYVAAVALLFLVLGGVVTIRLRKTPVPKSEKRQKSLSIVNLDGFSPRESEVLLFLCHGYTNSEIAEQLSITENTVKTHLKNIYAKLGVSNRTQAAAEAKILNIIE